MGKGPMDEVTLYVARGCPFCIAARAAHGRARTIEVDETPGLRERLARVTGSSTLPSVWVRGVYIGGWRTGPEPYGGLKSMIERGLLP